MRQWHDNPVGSNSPRYDYKKHRFDASAPLTSRQIYILDRLLDGISFKQIAIEMKLSNKTVGTHTEGIRLKLKAKTTYQAVVFYYRQFKAAQQTLNLE